MWGILKVLMIIFRSSGKGFTIVELLIVIVVIAILATVTIVAFNGVQSRARDSKRAQDISTIKKAILSYDVINSGVSNTWTYNPNYNSPGRGGWDASTDAEWLAFLRPQHGNMPVDPTNTLVNNTAFTGSKAYFYYCYPTGAGPLPASPNVRLIYYKDNGTLTSDSFAVSACL